MPDVEEFQLAQSTTLALNHSYSPSITRYDSLTTEFGEQVASHSYPIDHNTLAKVCAGFHPNAWFYPSRPAKRSHKQYAVAAKRLLNELEIENENHAFIQFYADRIFHIGKYDCDDFLGIGIMYPIIYQPRRVKFGQVELKPYTPLTKWRYLQDGT